ncbi:MAG: SDR family oxidoreductase [Ferruginibacter sp.]
MNILILGSEGFIGSHFVNYFLSNGHTVSGCDLIENSDDSYAYQKVSLLSPDFDTLFLSDKYDVCINAAGSGNVPFSLTHPISDFEANTMSVAKVLDTIHKHQPTCRYVHLSSAAVYGNPSRMPITEACDIAPLSPYGFHKWMSEILCNEYFRLYNLPVVILRPFSVYGERLRKQLFWDICQKLKDTERIELFGSGKETRDFIHVKDLCILMDKIINQASFKADVYNVASGNEISIRHVADIFESIMKGNKKINFSTATKQGDPLNWKADISKIQKLGFEAAIPLYDGIHDYIQWCSK